MKMDYIAYRNRIGAFYARHSKFSFDTAIKKFAAFK
jgi:hypothetical protein